MLFPTANQTRFEHSLGVYFLGKKLFNSILENSPEYCGELKGYQYTVEMACLLHDIGHAPMSHIGEEFYCNEEIKDKLKGKGILIDSDLASHEIMSVLVSLTIFEKELNEGGIFDKDLFFRLITGTSVESEGCNGIPLTPVKEAIIQILNSVFDVDKMDYVMRDSASAGIPIELDIDRIIGSAKLVDCNGKLTIAFGKSGFSVASSIIMSRNYLFDWIYSHHKVQYQQYILTQFIKKLYEKYDDFRKFFSYDTITGNSVKFGELNISYTDDYDLWYIFKNLEFSETDILNIRKQLFSRKHYKSLWKSKIEFDQIKEHFHKKLQYIKNKFENRNTDPFKKVFFKKLNMKELVEEDIVILEHNPKTVFPDCASNMYFYLEDKYNKKNIVKTYADLFTEKEEKTDIDKFMFHIFINEDKYNDGVYKKIIDTLSSL